MEWIEPYRALVRRYAAADQTHVKRRSDAWVDHEVVLLDSAFSVLDEIAVIERRRTSVEQLVERALSRSSTTEERLGDCRVQVCSRDRGAAASRSRRTGC